MMQAASGAVAATRALEGLMRNDRGRLMAALIARLGNFQLAEEALQDAMLSAVGHWGRNGVPAAPLGWLLQTAYRKAIDRLRQSKSEGRKVDALRLLTAETREDDANDIPDERLRLIFTCCHPALEPKSQVALTLRTICGLSTHDIAAVFLDAEPTMGQRLSRARAKITAAGIPYSVPEPQDWAERLQAVLAVIYLVFTSGYAGTAENRKNLAAEAIFLARLLDSLRPADPEIEGCLALLLITHARHDAREDHTGAAVPLPAQDRSRWDRALIAEGLGLLDRAMNRRLPGPYQIKAAIAACHIGENGSDWPQIVLLYDSLLRFEPTPVVRLHRAVALAEAGRPDTALALIMPLQAELGAYQPFHAALAELLARSGRKAEALAAYERAIALATNEADIGFLKARAQAVRE
ncbi:DUF6596 domain-containing protein [Devosia sp.]|uniref:RNA polymerase sigma factor n=1 Tax=Devosia sp. TaxID=1871048 RepID=UPI001B096485|nr:DUF6596 domain-containing protein [Devosia sp.]MBO9590597.1 hypothetical protein [Devosia sp.]